MKQKFIAIVLSITVALTMMPVIAFADTSPGPNEISDIYVRSSQSGNELIADGNSHNMAEKFSGAKGTYTIEGNTLILNNVEVELVGELVSGIFFYSCRNENKDLPLTIKLEGKNVLKVKNEQTHCISIQGNLNIEGPGSLTATNEWSPEYRGEHPTAPIAVQGSLHVKSGTLEANTINQEDGWGIVLQYLTLRNNSETNKPKESNLTVDSGAVLKAAGSVGAIAVVGGVKMGSGVAVTAPKDGGWKIVPKEQLTYDIMHLPTTIVNSNLNPTDYYPNGIPIVHTVYNKDGTFAKTVEIGKKKTPPSTESTKPKEPTKPTVPVKKVNKPAAPKRVKAKAISTSKIKVSWKKVKGASRYYVYRATKKNGKYTRIKKVKGAALTVKGLKADTRYYFKVRARSSAGYSKYSAKASARTKVWFSLKQKGKSKIKVTWQPQKGAGGYQVANNHGGKMKVRWTGNPGNRKYTSIKKKSGRTYKFKMRYYKVKKGKRVYSKWTSVKKIKMK